MIVPRAAHCAGSIPTFFSHKFIYALEKLDRILYFKLFLSLISYSSCPIEEDYHITEFILSRCFAPNYLFKPIKPLRRDRDISSSLNLELSLYYIFICTLNKSGHNIVP